MVTRFDLKYRSFQNRFEGLQETIRYGDCGPIAVKAALFDFTAALEQLWKVLKYVLETVDGCDGLEGSKKVFRPLAQGGYISYEEAELFLEMINLRNNLAHEYNDPDFGDYFEKITAYLPCFARMNERLLDIGNRHRDIFEKDIAIPD